MTAKRSEISTPGLCQFSFADGRRCRMLRAKDHPTLCLFHAQAEGQLVDSPDLGTGLPALLPGGFFTATDIHDVLGKLFAARAQNRVSQRDATILAYIAQLMIQTIPMAKSELYSSMARRPGRA